MTVSQDDRASRHAGARSPLRCRGLSEYPLEFLNGLLAMGGRALPFNAFTDSLKAIIADPDQNLRVRVAHLHGSGSDQFGLRVDRALNTRFVRITGGRGGDCSGTLTHIPKRITRSGSLSRLMLRC